MEEPVIPALTNQVHCKTDLKQSFGAAAQTQGVSPTVNFRDMERFIAIHFLADARKSIFLTPL
jgi:hypothetical protein